MKTFKINTSSSFDIPNTNLAIGNFDGLHIGHQTIIKQLVKTSRDNGFESAILSFLPHPRQYFTKNFEDFRIIDEKIKIELINNLNVDNYIIFEFNDLLASYTAEKFIEKILFEKLNISNLTVGYDFRFGKDRKGDTKLLKKLCLKYNFNLSIIDQIKDTSDSEIFSSSLVRENIKKGNFEKVSSLLGRNWIIQGIVIKGDQRARKMNFPTANIIPGKLIKPKKGVYAIKVKLNGKYFNGIANFGERPTVDGNKLLLEAHLFHFNEDLYGKELTVEFLTFIRDEKKFENFKLLTEQIHKDIQLVKAYQLNK